MFEVLLRSAWTLAEGVDLIGGLNGLSRAM